MASTEGGSAQRIFTTRRLLIGLVVAAIGVTVVLVWFQPQKLFQDTRVDEAPPGSSAEGGESIVQGDAPRLEGSFRGIDHETSGIASLTPADDGRHYVRLEDFSTENGPDLVVYLSTAPASAEGREFAEDFIDLGPLKGNIGNQNYLVPAETDLDKYQSVVIWCRRFTTPFGAAPLDQT